MCWRDATYTLKACEWRGDDSTKSFVIEMLRRLWELSYWLVHTVGGPLCPRSVLRTYVVLCIPAGSSHPCRGHLLPSQYLNFKIDHIPTTIIPCGSLKVALLLYPTFYQSCCCSSYLSLLLSEHFQHYLWCDEFFSYILMMFCWIMFRPIICVIQFSWSPIDPELLLTFSIP